MTRVVGIHWPIITHRRSVLIVGRMESRRDRSAATASREHHSYKKSGNRHAHTILHIGTYFGPRALAS